MKNLIYFIFFLFILAAVTATFLKKDIRGKDYIVTNISGSGAAQYQVQVQHPLDVDGKRGKWYRRRSEWIPLQIGIKTGSGDLIKTEKNAFVDLIIENGMAIRVKENSLLKLQQKEIGPWGTEVALNYGKVLCRVVGKKLKITALQVVALIRSASFSIDYLPAENLTKVAVLEGAVSVRSIENPIMGLDIPKGKRAQVGPITRDLVLEDITPNGLEELLETKELKIEPSIFERVDQAIDLDAFSPIYNRLLELKTKRQMEAFIRTIKRSAYSKWGRDVPNSLPGVELVEGGDCKDSWNTEYFYEKIVPKMAILISAGPDKILHTLDDIAMLIKLSN